MQRPMLALILSFWDTFFTYGLLVAGTLASISLMLVVEHFRPRFRMPTLKLGSWTPRVGRFASIRLGFDEVSIVIGVLTTAFILLAVMTPLLEFSSRRVLGRSLLNTSDFELLNTLANDLPVFMLVQIALPGIVFFALAARASVFDANGLNWSHLGLAREHLTVDAVLAGAKSFLKSLPWLFATVVLLAVGEHLRPGIFFTDELDPTMLLFEVAPLWVMFVLAVVLAPLVEEFIFRGMLYPLLAGSIGILPSQFTTAVVFSAVHFDQPLGGFIIRAVLGLFFVRAFEEHRSLLVPIIFHAIYNGAVLTLASAGVKM